MATRLARSGGAGDQQVRHGRQVGDVDAPVDVLADGERELRLVADEFLRLDHFAQPDGFALAVRHLDADRGLAGHALDEDALGVQGEAEIVGEAGDAAVLDAGFGLDLERGDDRAGIDLRDLSAHIELGALLGEHLREILELLFVDGEGVFGTMQQRARRKFVASGELRHGRLGRVPMSARVPTAGSTFVGVRHWRGRSSSSVRWMPDLTGATFAGDGGGAGTGGVPVGARRTPPVHASPAPVASAMVGLVSATLLEFLLRPHLGASSPPVLDSDRAAANTKAKRVISQVFDLSEREGGAEIQRHGDDQRARRCRRPCR